MRPTNILAVMLYAGAAYAGPFGRDARPPPLDALMERSAHVLLAVRHSICCAVRSNASLEQVQYDRADSTH